MRFKSEVWKTKEQKTPKHSSNRKTKNNFKVRIV